LFTKGKADPNHRPSIKSCLVRVPGTINSKNDQQVQVVQKWDGKRPAIQWITTDFKLYLIQKRMNKINEKKKRRTLSKGQIQQRVRQINRIEWIERLFQTPMEDYRKQCLWSILCPYLINIRKATDQEALKILEDWLKKCGELSPLNPITTKTIVSIKECKTVLAIFKRQVKRSIQRTISYIKK